MKKIETSHILSWHANLPYILSVTLNVVLFMKEKDINRRKRQKQQSTIVISKCSRMTFWFEKFNMKILCYRYYYC